MSTKDDGGPAFPRPVSESRYSDNIFHALDAAPGASAMNEIDLSTMTPEERQLMLDAEHRKPVRAPHLAWWAPLWIVALVLCCCGFFVALSHTQAHKERPAVTLGGPPVTLHPDATYCYMRRELLSARWTPASSEGERDRIAADRRKHLMPAPTLTCVDTASCDGRPAGCELTTVTLGQWWYETVRLPARRVIGE